MIEKLKKAVFVPFVVVCITCSLTLAPLTYVFTPQKAEAQWYVYNENFYPTMFYTGWTAGNTLDIALGVKLDNWKQFGWDTISWMLTNIVLQEMIRSVTAWVNSGFQGEPAFVNDLSGFLIKIADKVAGNFIFASGLGFLCSPFKLNLQLALGLQYTRTKGYQAKCTLSGVVGNIERFMNGDFLEGGWDQWYNVALEPGNNPYGAMLEAQAALSISVINAKGEQVTLLGFGQGFFGMKDSKGRTTTPGVVIQEQLNSALGLPGDRLVVADELNELIGALFAQLVGQMFSSAGGLLGLTDSSYGDGDYFDRMMAERTPRMYVNDVGIGSGTDQMQKAITDEEKYITNITRIISYITDARTYKERTYPSDSCHTGELTSSLANRLTSMQSELTASQNALAEVRVLFDDYSLLQNPTASTASTTSLLIEYDQPSIPATQAVILQDFMISQSSGDLHTSYESLELDMKTIPSIQSEIASFTSSIDTACRYRNSNGLGDGGGGG